MLELWKRGGQSDPASGSALHELRHLQADVIPRGVNNVCLKYNKGCRV